MNLQASWRVDCAVNVNILLCLAINSGPARDEMKYSIVQRKFSVKVFGYQMKVTCHSSAIILFQFQSSFYHFWKPSCFMLLVLIYITFCGCWGRESEGGGVRTTRLFPGALPLSPIILFYSVIKQTLKNCELYGFWTISAPFPCVSLHYPAFSFKQKRPCHLRWSLRKLNKRCFFFC